MKAYLVSHEDHFDFLWNLDCSVGRGGQNNLVADVKFIQWYYQLASANSETTPDRREIYKHVAVTGRCNGTDADPLVRAILAHQRALSHPVIDGRVSVARPGIKLNDTAFFVLRIGARLARMFPDDYPRLDRLPGCPAEVVVDINKAVPALVLAA